MHGSVHSVAYKLIQWTIYTYSETFLNIFAAPSVADVQAAIEYIFPLVYEFRKERTPEEIAHLALKKSRQLAHCGSPTFEAECQGGEEEDEEESGDAWD